MMHWFKQAALILILLLVTIGMWIRLDPGAAPIVAGLGVPDILISKIAGPGESIRAQSDRRPGATSEGNRDRGAGEGTPVVISQAGKAAINDRVSAIGDGEAVRSVAVVPRAEGLLTELRVKAGDRVEAGEIIAVLDLEKEAIARDQAQLAVKISEEKVDRFERLVKSRAVSEVQLIDTKNELANARLNLRNAEVQLARRSVRAPISGIVGILPVETGDFLTDQTEIVTIDDRSSLIIDFWVPERFASLVNVGQSVDAEPIAITGMTFPGEVTAVGSRVDRVSRTLQIRARIANEEDMLLPGMSFKVNLYFRGKDHVAVDPLAIQWSSNGPYVWKIAAEKSVKIPVRIIQRNADYVLVTGDIAAGEEVIIEGLQSLRPGAAIRVTRRSSPPVTEGS